MKVSIRPMVSVMWFRRDLRIHDQKALAHAIASKTPILCIFQFNQEQLGDTPNPSQTAFIQSVLTLRQVLSEHQIDLHLMYGDLITCFDKLYEQLADWTDVYFNYDEAGFGRLRDQLAAQFFRSKGIKIHAFQDHYLHGSQEVLNQMGQPYQVFTPYYKSWQELPKETPIDVDLSKGIWVSLETSISVFTTLEQLKGDEKNNLHQPGEVAARQRLDDFLKEKLVNYHLQRDIPSISGTSGLSPYLRSGEISIRTVYEAVIQEPSSQGQAAFIKELAWREFYNMVYVTNPRQKNQPIQSAFQDLIWDNNPNLFDLWKLGKTGYPIVDAAMKQLLETGWMHNRLRMIVASFLTKDLLIDWRWGELYFQKQLIDYDAASNIGGWQWAASTGTDAVPYFRIFNPTSQGKKFDPDGNFIKTYLPVLKQFPKQYIHEPWKLPQDLQEQLGVQLGRDYPYPILEHGVQRKIALKRYEEAKETAKNLGYLNK